MTNTQADSWINRTKYTTADDVLFMYHNPLRFQSEFSGYINEVGKLNYKGRKLDICEMGCEFGVTTLLLSADRFNRQCLDINPIALGALRESLTKLGETVKLHENDMFNSPFDDSSFDIIFNNGVLEHYNFAERAKALSEYTRILRPGGRIFIGVPNHFSFPYRFAYLVLNAMRKWSYPKEEKINDLFKEIDRIESLKFCRILYFDKETIFSLLPKHKYTSIPFRIMDKWINYEPYLRVIEIAKIHQTDISGTSNEN